MKLLFYIYIIIQLYLHKVNSAGFDYKDTSKWSNYYPVCGDKFQSPINIKFGNLEKIGERSPLRWCNYENVPMKMTLVNNGHSITLAGVWAPNNVPYIECGPLNDAYIFEQLHFHWGANDTLGSEHTINGNSFPLEMHIVHFKKQYRTFTNATSYRDGLAVIGFFFDIDSKSTDGLTQVLSGTAGVTKPGEKIELDPFALSAFDGVSFSVQFVTYIGSLTTPPCSQVVTWILPIGVLKVTSKQMKKFRSLKLNHGDDHNYRPTQPLNGRQIHIFTQWSKFYLSEVYQVKVE